MSRTYFALAPVTVTFPASVHVPLTLPDGSVYDRSQPLEVATGSGLVICDCSDVEPVFAPPDVVLRLPSPAGVRVLAGAHLS